MVNGGASVGGGDGSGEDGGRESGSSSHGGVGESESVDIWFAQISVEGLMGFWGCVRGDFVTTGWILTSCYA